MNLNYVNFQSLKDCFDLCENIFFFELFLLLSYDIINISFNNLCI